MIQLLSPLVLSVQEGVVSVRASHPNQTDGTVALGPEHDLQLGGSDDRDAFLLLQDIQGG